MVTTVTHQRDRHGAAAVRQAVLASKDRFWRSTDLALSQSTAYHLFGDLVAQGELRRVRRGLYWRGAKTPLGMAPPPPERLVSELAPGVGVGPAGSTAANVLRLSTQVPRFSETAVPYRPPTDVGAVRFVSRAARTQRRTARLNPTEVAVLEVLDAWPDVVEVPLADAFERLRSILDSPQVRAERIVAAAATEPGKVRARLRDVLERSGRADLAQRVPPSDQQTMAHALVAISPA